MTPWWGFDLVMFRVRLGDMHGREVTVSFVMWL